MKIAGIATVATAAVLLALVPAWGAEGTPGEAVLEAPRQVSIERLRRESYQDPDQDIVGLLESSPAAPPQPLPVLPPAPAREQDPYFVAILRQILADVPADDPLAKLAKEAREEARLRHQM